MANQLKFRGVFAHNDGGYTASIRHDRKQKYLGYFRNFESAKKARLIAEITYFGAVFDRREPIFEADHVKVPLHGLKGKFYGYALIDLQDYPLVQDISWTKDPRGYVAGRPAGSSNSVTLHRFILTEGGKYPARTIDHTSGDRLDNRRSNLRECSPAENARNTRLAKNNSSGAKGVSLDINGKWRARIWVDRKEIRIGTYDSIEAASAAYDRAAARLHGDFASPNTEVTIEVTGQEAAR